jgi:hypothetical protein
LRQVIPSPLGAPPGAIPKRAPLALHGDAGGTADLDPDPTWTGSIGAVDLLRNDTVGARRQACVKTTGPSSAMCSLNRMPAPVLHNSQRGLAAEEWDIAHILTVMLDEVEGIKDHVIGGFPTPQLVE